MIVTAAHTVPRVAPEWSGFAGMPPVFATAMMIGFVEQTCIAGLRPHLADSARTVGTHVDLSHSAPTPVGSSVTAEVTLTGVKGRSLQFEVVCFDDVGIIGSGTHRRAIVDVEEFMSAVEARRR